MDGESEGNSDGAGLVDGSLLMDGESEGNLDGAGLVDGSLLVDGESEGNSDGAGLKDGRVDGSPVGPLEKVGYSLGTKLGSSLKYGNPLGAAG